MRPVSLSICSFGPFREKQVISFESLSEIFLITGKTGSGKTTIFDALMYALYGKLPGTRDPKSIVSDYVDENAEPSVELVFSSRGCRYKIFRQPPIARKRSDGRESKHDRPPAAALYQMKGSSWISVPGKLTEINEYIENLLRLTADEFSKIVLLPQGEFQKFLVADTKEKTRLLEKLFPTKRHEEIGQIIKDRYLDRKKEADLIAAERDRNLTEFDPASHESSVAAWRSELAQTESRLGLVRNSIALNATELAMARELGGDFDEFEKNISHMKELTGKSAEMSAVEQKIRVAREALEIMPLIESRDDMVKDIRSLEKKISDSIISVEKDTADLAALSGQERSIPGMERAIAAHTEETGRVAGLIPKAKSLSQKKKEIELLDRSCAQADDSMKSLKKSLESNASSRSAIRESIENDEKNLLSYEEIVRDLADISRRCADLSAAAKKIDEAEKKKKILSQTRAEMDECSKKLARLREDESVLARHTGESAAAGLALLLRKGEPCPVCGSTEHPAPAQAAAATEISGEMSSLVSAITEAEKTIAGLSERAGNHSAALETLQREIAALTAEGGSLDEMAQRKKILEEKKKSLEKTRAGLIEKRKSLAGLEEEGARISARIDELAKKITGEIVARDTLRNEIESLSKECGDPESLASTADNLRKKTAELKASIDLITKQKKEKELHLKGMSAELASFREALTASSDKRSRLDEQISLRASTGGFSTPDEVRTAYLEKAAIASLEKRVREFGEDRKSTEKAIAFLTKKLSGKARPDIAALEKKNAELTADAAALERSLADGRISLRELQARKERHDSLTADLDRLLHETGSLAALSNDLNGKNPKKLTFQNFILGAYLEEVARYASLRLHSMSEERYTLMLNEEISHGNREAGLDLDVFDAFTGQRRNVKSLSGGEKFMASIALALGLADVIQSRSGGIELDAIFIDEGFGSLDDSALDRALGILDDIREDRTVGIISHVNELRNRIPSRIHVVKGPSGSRIEMQ